MSRTTFDDQVETIFLFSRNHFDFKWFKKFYFIYFWYSTKVIHTQKIDIDTDLETKRFDKLYLGLLSLQFRFWPNLAYYRRQKKSKKIDFWKNWSWFIPHSYWLLTSFPIFFQHRILGSNNVLTRTIHALIGEFLCILYDLYVSWIPRNSKIFILSLNFLWKVTKTELRLRN